LVEAPSVAIPLKAFSVKREHLGEAWSDSTHPNRALIFPDTIFRPELLVAPA